MLGRDGEGRWQRAADCAAPGERLRCPWRAALAMETAAVVERVRPNVARRPALEKAVVSGPRVN
jgi:hypothetical protein